MWTMVLYLSTFLSLIEHPTGLGSSLMAVGLAWLLGGAVGCPARICLGMRDIVMMLGIM